MGQCDVKDARALARERAASAKIWRPASDDEVPQTFATTIIVALEPVATVLIPTESWIVY